MNVVARLLVNYVRGRILGLALSLGVAWIRIKILHQVIESVGLCPFRFGYVVGLARVLVNLLHVRKIYD